MVWAHVVLFSLHEHCLRYTRAHVALSSLQACPCCTVFVASLCRLHCLRYTSAHVAMSSLHPCPCCTVLATRVYMLCFQAKSPRCTSGCLSLLCRNARIIYALKYYLLTYRLTLFSCSEDISLFTRSFLASSLSALMNMFCL